MSIKILSGEKGKMNRRKLRPVGSDVSQVVAHLNWRMDKFFSDPDPDQDPRNHKKDREVKRVVPAWLRSE